VPKGDEAQAVRRAWPQIISRLFPKAMITHRTAFDYQPTRDGDVYLTAGTTRDVAYPGLILHFRRGPGPLEDDPGFLEIRASSLPRLLLENLSTTHPSTKSRVAPLPELERRLEQTLHARGEDELNAIRDRAKTIAHELGWMREFDRLDGIIGALLGTRTGHLSSAVGRARASGAPFDERCVERLQLLFGELRTRALPLLEDRWLDVPRHFTNKAFFDAYFSNYIEGTTFRIEEAERIIFDNQVPDDRPVDAHDIMGTYRIVSDRSEMQRTPATSEDLIDILRHRHATVLAQRPEASPGSFKTKPNYAGETQFVHPEYVVGTLAKGMELHIDLEGGLPRAVFMMFLISDVHPFVDGNGRLARIMMNVELVAANRPTTIVPTVFRDDYLLALRALTRRHRPQPLVDALVKAQRFSTLDFSDYPRVQLELERRNWFREPGEARIIADG